MTKDEREGEEITNHNDNKCPAEKLRLFLAFNKYF